MASNYLQRVAIVGSRTVGAAKPAVIGPPDMPGSAPSAGPPVMASPPPLSDRMEDPSRPPLDLERPRRAGAEPIERAVESTAGPVTEPVPELALPQAGGSGATDDAATVGIREGTPKQAMIPQAPQPASIGHLRPEIRSFIRAPRGLRPVAEPPSTATAALATLPTHDEAIVAPPRERLPVTPSQPPAHEEPTVGLPVDTTIPTGDAEPTVTRQSMAEPRLGRPNNGSSRLARLPMPAAAEPGRSDEMIAVASAAPPVNPPEQVALAVPTHRVSFPEVSMAPCHAAKFRSERRERKPHHDRPCRGACE